jgi:hypothetical protein
MAWRARGNSIPAAIVTTLSTRISPASVAGLGAAMGFADLPPRQLGELAAQPGLVALHRQHPVRAAGVQIGDVFALGVQRVRGDHHTGQVDIGQVQLILAENTRRFNARPVPSHTLCWCGHTFDCPKFWGLDSSE